MKKNNKRPPLAVLKRSASNLSSGNNNLLMTSFSSAHFSSHMQMPVVRKSLMQKLHCYQDVVDKETRDMTSRLSQKDMFQMMLQ